MSKEMMNTLKRGRASLVGGTPGKSGIVGMAKQRASMCSPEREMGRSTRHMDPDGVQEVKKMKFRG